MFSGVDAKGTKGKNFARQAVFAALAGGAVLAATLLNFLAAEYYPVLTPEVALLALALAGVAAAMALVYAFAFPLLRALLAVFLLLIALDINFDGWAVLAGTAAIAIIVNRHLMTFLGIAASVVLLTELPYATYLRSDERASGPELAVAAGDRSLPPLVHIIVDEHIGVEGLIDDSAAREMGDDLKSFYLSQGFHLAGGAYSEHFHTLNAIPAMLNFGEAQAWVEETSKRGSPVPNNRYFEVLRERGYAINVHQSPYLDYCVHDAVSNCRTSPKSLLLVAYSADLPAPELARLIGREFARLSWVLTTAGKVAEAAFGFRTSLRDSHLPMAAPELETLDLVASQLRRNSRGAAFLVHVLFPHYPYVFDRKCMIKPLAGWQFRRSTLARKSPLHERQAAYYEQIRCLLLKLTSIFDAAGEDAVIIVNGDHGSRITGIDPAAHMLGRFSDADLIASFSALYAVRAPGTPAGYDRRALPLGLLLKEFVQSGFRNARPVVPDDFQPSVVLETAEWKPAKRHPLPVNWPQR
jgi:hypothetical protein